MRTPRLSAAEKWEVDALLREYHYIGTQCADPTHILVWRGPGGLFGDYGQPICAALFAPPASSAWGVRAIELIRLVRDEPFVFTLSRFLAECISWLKATRKWEVVLAYADPSAGHHGGVYQAANFFHLGTSSPKAVYLHPNGRRLSMRAFDQSRLKGRSEWTRIRTSRKFIYAYALTRQSRRTFGARAMPYPKPQALKGRP